MARTLATTAVTLAAILGLAAVATAQPRAALDAAWCYDEARDALSRVLPDSCTGRLVGDAEAARLRDARAERVRGVIGDARPRGVPGNPQPFSTLPSDPGLPRSAAPPTLAPRQPEITIGRMVKGAGTGFFINETGAVLTNLHVVGACGAITVTGFDRVPVTARVSAVAQAIDLAVLHAAIVPPAVAELSKDPAKAPSDRAAVVGFSLRGQPTTTATLTSAHARPETLATDQWRFAFDGKAFPGHSGSPLLNQFGEVVGVVHARAVSKVASAGRPPRPDESKFGLAISMRAMRQFLADSKVATRNGAAGRSFSDIQILERARRFVVRVQCWS